MSGHGWRAVLATGLLAGLCGCGGGSGTGGATPTPASAPKAGPSTTATGKGATAARPTGKTGAPPAAAAEPAKPLGEPKFRATVAELVAEFNRDNKATQAKYIGQVVEVTGLVEHVTRTDPTEVRVGLREGPSGRDGINFKLAKPEAPRGVMFDRWVTLRGVCADTPGVLFFTAAEVVKVGDMNGAAVASRELMKQYLADPAGTHKKYENGRVVATGKVLSVTGPGVQLAVELEGEGGVPLRCEPDLKGDPRPPAELFKPGTTATLVGLLTTPRPGEKSPFLWSAELVEQP